MPDQENVHENYATVVDHTLNRWLQSDDKTVSKNVFILSLYDCEEHSNRNYLLMTADKYPKYIQTLTDMF